MNHDEQLLELEAGRWQDAIYKLLVKETDDSIDGGGCDSGDPLDFTISEISQAIGILKEQLAREREANQGLRQVVKEYREFHINSRRPCVESATCSTCQEADALLEPKSKPVATTS